MNSYIEMRERFNPLKAGVKVKVAFVAESPPEGGNYFYNVDTNPKSALFKNLMEALKIDGGDKTEKLTKFQRHGYVLLDATSRTINRLKGKARAQAVEAGLPRLVAEIESLRPRGVVIIKASLYKPVKHALDTAGFSALLLHREPIPFPMYGYERRFKELIAQSIL